MDPPLAASFGRSSSGKGGRARQRRVGLNKPSIPAPSPSPASSSLVPPPPPISSSATVAATPAAPTPFSVALGMAACSSPATTSTMPPQAPGWGAMLPNFPSQHVNQQAPNPWGCPPGGYLNFLQQPHYPPHPHMQGENFHLVGQAVRFDPISPTPPGRSQVVNQGTSTKDTVNIDIEEGENSEPRHFNKRYWTHEEEERLAYSWLNASKDPIHGNDKKGDTFWKEVTHVFNDKGNGKRRRELNQLKIHWSRLKTSIGEFNDYWTKVTQMHTSGYSDDVLEKEAQKMYANKFGKPFALVHWWKILKDEPKWCAQFEMEKDKTEVVDVPDEHSRPIGREAAKAERNGKRKKKNFMEGIVILGDSIEKIIKVEQDRNVERQKVTEAQIQISNANLKAATEEKEAKMFQVYNTLLTKDTSNMSEAQKAKHEKAIHKLEEMLFAE